MLPQSLGEGVDWREMWLQMIESHERWSFRTASGQYIELGSAILYAGNNKAGIFAVFLHVARHSSNQ